MSKQYESPHRYTAKSFLAHYIKLAATRTVERWNWENTQEVESIIDNIIEAAKDELRRELAEARSQAKDGGQQ